MMKRQTVKKSEFSNVERPSQQNKEAGIAQFKDNRSGAMVQRKLQGTMNDSSGNESNPIQRKANKTGLPDNLKSGIENLSGYSMDDVKVHYNSSKPAQLQAHAYAQGSDIHLASGQEKHLPHEAWHVVQQKQGRVKPTMQLKSKVNINDDAGLEKEADVMGARSSKANNQNESSSVLNQSSGKGSKTVQRYIYRTNDNPVTPTPQNGQNANMTGYEPEQNRTTFQNANTLRNELRNTNPNVDDGDLMMLSNELWRRFGTDANEHIDTLLIYQIFRDLDRVNRGRNFDYNSFLRYLRIYLHTRTEGFRNVANGGTLLLGRFRPQPRNTVQDANEWWFRGPDSYIQVAGNNNDLYFDLGNRWDELVNSRNHDIDDVGMFHVFNTYALDYVGKRINNAVAGGLPAPYQVIFIDHPDEFPGTSLKREWSYLQERHGFTTLVALGDGTFEATI